MVSERTRTELVGKICDPSTPIAKVKAVAEAFDKLDGDSDASIGTFIDPQEACIRAGVAKSTLYSWMAEDLLPSYKIRGRRFIDPQELSDFIKKEEKND